MKTFSIIFLSLLSFISYSQNLMTVGEVFNFSVGDKFHYTVNPPSVPDAVDRITITAKYYSDSGDTVFYENYHDSYWSEVEWVPSPHLVYHFYTLTDTVFYTGLDSLISYYDSGFQCNPEWYICDTSIYNSDQYCGALINGYDISTNDFEPDVYSKQYGEGLGWVYSYYYSGSNVPPGVVYQMSLFYYQKDGIDCGTPDTITVSVPEITPDISAISIYPNPAKDYFRVELEKVSGPVQYWIYDVFGKLLDEGQWTGKSNIFSCAGFAPGIYQIRVNSGNTMFNYKLIIQ